MSKSTAVKLGGQQAEVVEFDPTNMESMSGAGSENATQDDYAIPFINIAQALSPQMDSDESVYIEGLQKGDLFNTVTSEVFTDGVTVIPVKFERKAIEFNLREEGGGLVAIHEPEVGLAMITGRDDRGRDVTDDGTQIVDTRSFYCLVQGKDGWFPALVSMKSTQAKKAKQWMSMISGIKWQKQDGSGMFTPPMFANQFEITTAKESNNDGTWHGFVIALKGPMSVEDPEFQEAAAFYQSLGAGEVKVDYGAHEGKRDEEDGDNPL